VRFRDASIRRAGELCVGRLDLAGGIAVSQVANAIAKLAGIRKSLIAAMNVNVSRARSRSEVIVRSHFPPDEVGHYFAQTATHIETLRAQLPDLFGDFQTVDVVPAAKMAESPSGTPVPDHYSRAQTDRLVRDIEQVFEIRANSELGAPQADKPRRVFISHGRTNDWRAVQAIVEKDVGLSTLELAQEPNLGRTIIEKLFDNAARCDSAIIVMTGDDIANGDEIRIRENVMHELGFFQGKYGRSSVVLLHEEGVNVPVNLQGVAYIPFPRGTIESASHVLQRELRAIYSL
jgi:predicted nucleotide-binding protein